LQVLAQVLTPDGQGIGTRGGVYHLTCAGATTWFGFAKALLTNASQTSSTPLPKLIPIPTSDFPRPATRPANSRLSCERLEETFGVKMPQWDHALALVMETLNQPS
jgi:dTDP-4-dehydrorhamnose reductase